jgi:hypothetical protein
MFLATGKLQQITRFSLENKVWGFIPYLIPKTFHSFIAKTEKTFWTSHAEQFEPFFF